ncbi:MAG TPA: cupin domain-containing protein [Bacteroidales bacterium]|nr:cupin domain-containing protein [Bacteroidales bacterium]
MQNQIYNTFVLRKEINYSTGAVVSKIIYNNSNDNNITLFAFDANQKLSEHKAPFDAFVQILEGNAQIIINKQTFNLSEGQAIIMPANISHAINANEKFKMLLIMIK